jgi:hypothetical protein
MDPGPPSVPPSAVSSAPPADTELIAEDRPCLACGYNLRGLPRGENCPECGQPIARSLQGNLLRFSSPEYIATLHRGTIIVQASLILMVIISVAGIIAVFAVAAAAGPAGANKVQPYVNAANAVLYAMSLVGWWLLSSADPAFVGSENGATARKVVRATVAINAVGQAVTFIVGVPGTAAFLRGKPLTGSDVILLIVSLAAGVAWIVGYFASMRYIGWLAPRFPSERIRDRAKMLMWLGPVLYIFGCGIGQIVLLVLYYNLLDWIRNELKRIRGEQDSGYAAIVPPPL